MHTDQRTSDSRRLTITYLLIVAAIAALYRLAPYFVLRDRTEANVLWNMAAVGGLSLFAGSRLRQRWAFLIPVGMMLLSDLLLIAPLLALNLSPFSWGTPIIYASFTLYVFMGRLIRPDDLSPMVIGGAVLLGSLQFFLVTNFAVWVGGALYPRTLTGLVECYTLAIPFYRGTLAGDLFFSGLIFGVHAVLLGAGRRQKVRQFA
jgi:hypothetical protein